MHKVRNHEIYIVPQMRVIKMGQMGIGAMALNQ